MWIVAHQEVVHMSEESTLLILTGPITLWLRQMAGGAFLSQVKRSQTNGTRTKPRAQS